MYIIDDAPEMTIAAQTPFKLEGLTTSVDNADFLSYTLPMNLMHFDKFVVVTAPEDKATQQVCAAWDVQCIQTDAFETRWGKFQKGKGINVGLRELDKDAWILHLDADIALPPRTRTILQTANLDTTMIYGVDRAMCPNFAEWQRFYGKMKPQHAKNIFVDTTHSFPLGTRVYFPNRGGYIPIGFFQLWHADSGNLAYPEGHATAAREDVLFPAQWDRSKRGFIPELIVYHLESEWAAMATNWEGRVTRPFHVDSMS